MSLYLEHFGLTEPPFRITPGTRFFYDGSQRGEVLTALQYAVESGAGLVKVVGEVGSGKTMLCRVLIERLAATIQSIYLPVPTLTRDELLIAIADELGIADSDATTSTTRRLKAIQEQLLKAHGAGKQVVVLLDEAHAMPLQTLEELRLISNLETDNAKLLQIVLFGQPELDVNLSNTNMRQLRDRITESFHLSPLPRQDVQVYLDFRLRQAGYRGATLFNATVAERIAQSAQGLSRRINVLADKTLLAAYAGGTHEVTLDHVAQALGEVEPAKRDSIESLEPERAINEAATPKHAPTSSWSQTALIAAAAATIGAFVSYAFLWRTNPDARPAATVQTARTVHAAYGPIVGAPTPEVSLSPATTSPATVPTAAVIAQATVPTTPTTTPTTSAQSLPAKPSESDQKLGGAPASTAMSIGTASAPSLTEAGLSPAVIQLVSANASDAKALAVVTAFAANAQKSIESTRVIQAIEEVRVNGTTTKRVALLINGFDSVPAATTAIPNLPESLRQYKPYARSSKGLLARVSQ